MKSLESEVRDLLTARGVEFCDKTDSSSSPDFTIIINNTPVALELKEKRQRIKLSNWPATSIPEKHLFLVDELTARKLLVPAPYAGIIVRDNIVGAYIFINVIDLWTMPRIRVNRVVSEGGYLKGKWMLDQRNGVVCKDLLTAMQALQKYAHSIDDFSMSSECVGTFVGEYVQSGGEIRQLWQKQYDYGATR